MGEMAWRERFPGRRSSRSGPEPEREAAGVAGTARGRQAAAQVERGDRGGRKR